MSKWQRWLLLGTTAMFWFAMYTYPVLLSTHVTDGLGGTPAMAGLVVGSYGFTQMLLRIPIGYLSDRLRQRKPFLMLGAGCTCLAALGLYAARQPGLALIARGTAGVAASTWVCFTVLYSSGIPAARRTRAMGVLSACMYAAQLVANLLGGMLARASGIHATFLLAAFAGIVAFILASRVKDRPPEAAPVSLAVIPRILKNRRLLWCALLSILSQMILWSTLYGFSPSWARTVLGADAAQISLLSIVHLIPTIIFSTLGASLILPRLGARNMLRLGFGCMAVSCLCMPITRALWQMLALQALCGIGVGCTAPLLLAQCNRDVAPAHQGIAMGAYQSLYGIGMFIGPILAGWLMALAGNGDNAAGSTQAIASGCTAVFIGAGVLAILAIALCRKLPPTES